MWKSLKGRIDLLFFLSLIVHVPPFLSEVFTPDPLHIPQSHHEGEWEISISVCQNFLDPSLYLKLFGPPFQCILNFFDPPLIVP